MGVSLRVAMAGGTGPADCVAAAVIGSLVGDHEPLKYSA